MADTELDRQLPSAKIRNLTVWVMLWTPGNTKVPELHVTESGKLCALQFGQELFAQFLCATRIARIAVEDE